MTSASAKRRRRRALAKHAVLAKHRDTELTWNNNTIHLSSPAFSFSANIGDVLLTSFTDHLAHLADSDDIKVHHAGIHDAIKTLKTLQSGKGRAKYGRPSCPDSYHVVEISGGTLTVELETRGRLMALGLIKIERSRLTEAAEANFQAAIAAQISRLSYELSIEAER